MRSMLTVARRRPGAVAGGDALNRDFAVHLGGIGAGEVLIFGGVDVRFDSGEFVFGDFLAEADFAFGGVVLGFAVVRLHVELHAGDGDEHEKYTEDESPVFDGGPFEALGVGLGEGGTLRRVLSYAHDVVVPFGAEAGGDSGCCSTDR